MEYVESTFLTVPTEPNDHNLVLYIFHYSKLLLCFYIRVRSDLRYSLNLTFNDFYFKIIFK